MREGSAEMNTLLHSARFQSEIGDVLGDGVCVEEVTCINKNNIAIQALRECCPDAEEERKSMRRFTLKEDKLARFENQRIVYRLYPGGYARLDVSGEVASSTRLVFDLVVCLSQDFEV